VDLISSRDVWIENHTRNRRFAVIWGLLASGNTIVGGVLVVLAARKTAIGAIELGVSLGLLALSSARSAWGSAHAAIKVTDRAVIVRNVWKTREIPIADIARFTTGRGGIAYNATPGVVVQLKDGRAYPVWTLAREGNVWNSKRKATAWQGVADELNRLLRDRPD
jgi:hypothetical protein